MAQINLYAIRYKKKNGTIHTVRAYSTSMKRVLLRAKQKKINVVSVKRLKANVKAMPQKRKIKSKTDKIRTPVKTAKKHPIIGRVFYSSWGYDQTNYDFFVVKSVSPSGKTAMVQRAKVMNRGSSGQNDVVKPTSRGYGKQFRVRIEKKYDGEWNLRGSVPFTSQDSSTRLRTLWLAKKGSLFYPTNSMFGH